MSTPEPVAVGIDVGGTKLVAATIDRTGRVLERHRVATPVPRGDTGADPEGRLVEALRATAVALAPGLPVGVGIAGIIARGQLEYSPNLAVSRVPLQEQLTAALQVPVTVVNDATAAGWGEVRAGAGRGVDDLVMFTLGTGVGGAVVLDGRPVLGANGFAGELGHVVVREGGRPCPCGNAGCVEAYASGTAIGALARERLADTDTSLLHDVDVVDGKSVTQAAGAGDDLAIEVLREAGFWLGVAAASVVNAFDPAVVLVGGGAAPPAAEWLLPAARAAMTERLMGAGYRTAPPVRLAALGDDAGMVGAALLAVSDSEGMA